MTGVAADPWAGWEPYEPAPFVAQCDRCGRMTVVASEIGTEDRMRQPDGRLCGGTFEAVAT